MASISSVATSLCNEREAEQLVQQMLSLWEQGLHGSTIILVRWNQVSPNLSQTPVVPL